MKVKSKCYKCGKKAYFIWLSQKDAKRLKKNLKHKYLSDGLGVECDKCSDKTKYKIIGIDIAEGKDFTITRYSILKEIRKSEKYL